MSPRTLFKTFAFAEAVTWAGLITAMALRAADVTEAAVRPAGAVHGFVFLVYCTVTVMVWVDHRWSVRTGLAGLGSAVIPFATIPFDVVADRRDLLPAAWRLGPDGGEEPVGLIERLQAWVLRNAVLAFLLTAVGITAVFVLLLWLGPPV